jgi:hypothetical protein
MRSIIFVAVLALATSAHAQNQTRQNDSRVGTALSGLGVDLDGRAWGAVPAAFEALYPKEPYDDWSLSGLQARAVAYVALLIAVDGDTAGVVLPMQPVDLRAEARALASIALSQLGGIVPDNQRREVSDHFANAAGAAGRADCSVLATHLAYAARQVRSPGWVSNSTLRTIAERITSCR